MPLSATIPPTLRQNAVHHDGAGFQRKPDTPIADPEPELVAGGREARHVLLTGRHEALDGCGDTGCNVGAQPLEVSVG